MSKNNKYNESCIRIFDILKLFSKRVVDFSEVITLFADENGKITQNSNVLLNKYLNTLKIFGVDFVKSKNVYYVKKMPFTYSFSDDDLDAVSLILSYLTLVPKGVTKNNLTDFLNNLEERFDDNTKQRRFSQKKSLINSDLYVYFVTHEKTISEVYNACLEKKRIEMTCKRGPKTLTAIVNPMEIRYESDKIIFSSFNNLTRQVIDTPIHKVVSIKKLNSTFNSNAPCMSVVFTLKGSLAKRYKLREWERAENTSVDSELTVVNEGEDLEVLISRLLRYGENCTVVSPIELKNEIKSRIRSTLDNYNV